MSSHYTHFSVLCPLNKHKTRHNHKHMFPQMGWDYIFIKLWKNLKDLDRASFGLSTPMTIYSPIIWLLRFIFYFKIHLNSIQKLVRDKRIIEILLNIYQTNVIQHITLIRSTTLMRWLEMGQGEKTVLNQQRLPSTYDAL